MKKEGWEVHAAWQKYRSHGNLCPLVAVAFELSQLNVTLGTKLIVNLVCKQME